MNKGSFSNPQIGRRTFLRATFGAGALFGSGGRSFSDVFREAHTELQDSITKNGVTLFFDRLVPVFTDVTGEPCILSDREFVVVDQAPLSIAVDGYIANGMMVNPFSDFANPSQGYDGALELKGLGASSVRYEPALNVSLPYTVPAGSNLIFAKSVRRKNLKGNVKQWGLLQDIVAFTVLGRVPFEDFYRPGMSYFAAGTPFDVKRDLPRKSSMTLRVLRNLPTPAKGSYSYANMLSYLEQIQHFPWQGYQGENLRRFFFDPAAPSNCYAGDYGGSRASVLTMMHSDALDATQKEALADLTIRQGLEIFAAIKNGWQANKQFQPWDGAGQWHGYHPQLYTAAFLLQNQEMLEACQLIGSNMQDNISWILDEDIGSNVGFPGPSGQQSRYDWTFPKEDLGKPHWNEKFRGSQRTARYFGISTPVGTSEMFAVILLQNGPGGVSGYEAFLNGGPHDTRNPRAAGVDLFDRWLTLCSVGKHGRQYRHTLRGEVFLTNEFYTTENWRMLALPAQPKWTGMPETYDVSHGDISMAADQFVAGRGDGEISFDMTRGNLSLSTTPITRHFVRHSLDGIQFVEKEVSGNRGSIGGLMKGAQYWCGYAVENARGKGNFSVNFPISALEHDPRPNGRNKPKTNGTDQKKVPVNTVSPKVHYPPYPDWVDAHGEPAPWYQEAPVVLTPDIQTLFAGVGDFDGFPAPVFRNFEWRRNGKPIPKGTLIKYELQADDLGQLLSYEFDATNDAGSVRVSGNSVQVYEAPDYPSDTVIDTDCRSSFRLFWQEVNATLRVLNANVEYRSNKVFAETKNAPTSIKTSTGSIAAAKTGSRPEIWMNLAAKKPLSPGATYRVRIDLPISFGNPQTVGTQYRLNKVDHTGSYYTGDATHATLENAGGGNAYVGQIDRTFRVAADETELDLWFWAKLDVGTGVNAGGDIEISNIHVQEVVPAPEKLNLVSQTVFTHDGERGYDHSALMPAGITKRKLLLAFEFLSSITTVTSVPEGWELVDEKVGVDNSLRIYRRTADGSEGGQTYTWHTAEASISAFFIYEVNLQGDTAMVQSKFNYEPDRRFSVPAIDMGSQENTLLITMFCGVRSASQVLFGPIGYEGFNFGMTEPDTSNSGAITMMTAFYEGNLRSEAPEPFGVKQTKNIFQRIGCTVGVRGKEVR